LLRARRSTQKLNFDFIRDIAPVPAIMRMPNVMLVTIGIHGMADVLRSWHPRTLLR
jgi:hypothetical protein